MRLAGPLVALLIAAEIIAAVAVADATSWGTTVLLLLVLSVVGGALVRRAAVAAVRTSRRRGATDASGAAVVDAVDGGLRLGAALLVAVPGFVTGALGLLLLLPPARALLRRTVGQRLVARLPVRLVTRPQGDRRSVGEHPVIDGELSQETPWEIPEPQDRPDGR